MNRIVKWESPSNIALVKYWGKHGVQLPNNPSISFTLNNSKSITSVELIQKTDKKVEFYLENELNNEFSLRIEKYLNNISSELSFINDYCFIINSTNTFPHSAGIASSASAFSALAMCLVDLDSEINNNKISIEKASNLARLGSGSACRSVYGGVSMWGKTQDIEYSSNEHAISLNNEINSIFKNYHDDIVIVDADKKSVSSSAGHKLMDTNPYSTEKYNQAFVNTKLLYNALKGGDINEFIRIIELEALSLHSMMMISNPSFILIKPQTLNIINRIREFRNDTNIPVCFTLDAGPNVHILYPDENNIEVTQFISSEMNKFRVINDCVGKGPLKL